MWGGYYDKKYSIIMKKIKGGKGMGMFSIFVIERFHYQPN